MWSRIDNAITSLAGYAIRLWVLLSGKRVAKEAAPWLQCPMGPPGRIGAGFYEYLAEREHLRIERSPDAGLLPCFDALKGHGFDPAAVHPAVRDFYEHTACYHLEAWSDAGVWTRVFLWALTRFVSRPMDQLNFPVSSLELGRRHDQRHPADGRCGDGAVGLHRLAAADGGRGPGRLHRPVFRGTPGDFPDPCVKVSFPVPCGSATVFLRPEAAADGSFRLISSGSRFGGSGFYRMLETDAGHWRVRHLRTLRETFHVYVDREGVLRTQHTVRFLGFTVLRLAYKTEWVGPVGSAKAAKEEPGIIM